VEIGEKKEGRYDIPFPSFFLAPLGPVAHVIYISVYPLRRYMMTGRQDGSVPRFRVSFHPGFVLRRAARRVRPARAGPAWMDGAGRIDKQGKAQ